MKKYTTLALIGAIVASVAGLISIDAISATPLVTMQGASNFHESGLMIGHVTYEVRGADGLIKQYLQGDNVITRIGTDCAAKAIFDSVDTICPSLGNFAYIAIGNSTGVTAATNSTLGTFGGGKELRRSLVAIDATILTNTGAGTVVSISNTGSPFNFVGLGMPLTGTTITQSGLFDAASAGNMFAIKPVTVLVLPADTLGVTWTITLT